MNNPTLLLGLSGLVVLTACADPYRGLYEGMQQREGIVNPAAKPAEHPMPYDRYEAERKKLREKDPEK